MYITSSDYLLVMQQTSDRQRREESRECEVSVHDHERCRSEGIRCTSGNVLACLCGHEEYKRVRIQ